MRNFILHTAKKDIIVTEADAFAEAERQEKSGISPAYSWRDCRTGKPMTAPGWLVWSTYADGCGVVYRRSDGKMILVTGWQGDFVCN